MTLRSTAAVLLATLVIAPSGAAAPLIDQIGGVAFGPASPR